MDVRVPPRNGTLQNRREPRHPMVWTCSTLPILVHDVFSDASRALFAYTPSPIAAPFLRWHLHLLLKFEHPMGAEGTSCIQLRFLPKSRNQIETRCGWIHQVGGFHDTFHLHDAIPRGRSNGRTRRHRTRTAGVRIAADRRVGRVHQDRDPTQAGRDMNPYDETEPMPCQGTGPQQDPTPDPIERQQAVERTQPAEEERRAETGLDAAHRTEWIAKHVTRVLRKAATVTRTEPRKDLCANLFSDLVGEVQDARTEEDRQDRRKNGRKQILCFYEILAPYYETLDTADVDELLQCFHKLWGSPHIPSIFTLLLHRWLFSNRVDRSQLLKYANVVADGAKPLRRWDILRGETRFKPVFLYLTYEVTLSPKKVQAITEDVRKVLVRYVVQSFLFYETRQRLPDLLERLAVVIKGIDALELFMLENSRELEQISVESALLRYLEGLETMATLPQWNRVAKVSKARLQSTIHSLTSPGGPRYPPRSVRHAAIHTLDVLYPQGRHARRMVIYFSRLMHPLFWPQSVAHHVGHWLGIVWLWAMLQQACSKAKERLRLRRD